MGGKYKVGWKDRAGKWHYILVSNKADMIAEVDDKTCLSSSVSIRIVTDFKIGDMEVADD